MTNLLESHPPFLLEVHLEEYFSIIFTHCENTNLTEVVGAYFGAGGYQIEHEPAMHPCAKEYQQHLGLH